MDEKFKDFVPAGQDAGAITDGGFQDWVPTPEPVKQVIEETHRQPVSDATEDDLKTPEETYTVPPLSQEETK